MRGMDGGTERSVIIASSALRRPTSEKEIAPGPAADSRSAATSADTGPSKSEPELGQRAEPLQGLSEVRPLTTTPVEVVAAVA